MKKINPVVAIGLALLALVVVIFAIRFSSQAADANGASLIPKPRADSPTFAPRPEDVAAGKSKTHQAPNPNAAEGK